MLKSKPDIENLNRWWNTQDTPLVWQARWLFIWSADIILKGCTFMWGIYNRQWSLYKQASKFILGTGTCTHCHSAIESIPHIFFNSPFARDMWIQTAKYYGAPNNNNMVVNSNSFLDLLDHCQGNKALNTAQTLILYKMAFMIWKLRNKEVFHNKERGISITHIAHLAKMHALAIINYTKSLKKKQRMTSASTSSNFT
jgi:hypothetical protein